MPGARAPAAARGVVGNTRVSHHEYTGITTASTVPAPIRRKNISAACVAPRSAFTIKLLARICFAMRRSRHGAKTIAVSRMANKWSELQSSP